MDTNKYDEVIKNLDMLEFWNLILTAIEAANPATGWQHPDDDCSLLRTIADEVEAGRIIVHT